MLKAVISWQSIWYTILCVLGNCSGAFIFYSFPRCLLCMEFLLYWRWRLVCLTLCCFGLIVRQYLPTSLVCVRVCVIGRFFCYEFVCVELA